MFNIDYELNEKIHAIIINPYLSLEELNANCDLIQKYNIRNVSTSLNFLSHIKDTFNNYKVKGFPVATIVNGEIVMENNKIISPAKGKPLNFN